MSYLIGYFAIAFVVTSILVVYDPLDFWNKSNYGWFGIVWIISIPMLILYGIFFKLPVFLASFVSLFFSHRREAKKLAAAKKAADKKNRKRKLLGEPKTNCFRGYPVINEVEVGNE